MLSYYTCFFGKLQIFHYLFIDNYSRHKYIELIHEKSDWLEAFKFFEAAKELQKNEKIKTVRSDKGGSIMTGMTRLGRIQDHSKDTSKYLTLKLNIQC